MLLHGFLIGGIRSQEGVPKPRTLKHTCMRGDRRDVPRSGLAAVADCGSDVSARSLVHQSLSTKRSSSIAYNVLHKTCRPSQNRKHQTFISTSCSALATLLYTPFPPRLSLTLIHTIPPIQSPIIPTVASAKTTNPFKSVSASTQFPSQG
jgi:hypothetical protein